MRSFFAFALFALTSVRAERVERIFVDGKGVPNLAAASGSNTSPTQLIQAAFTGSGSVLSQFSNVLNNPSYQNVDANIFSIKPTRAPLAGTPPSLPPAPPAPTSGQAPAPAFGDEITINGFTLGSSGSPTTTAAPTTTTMATNGAPMTTTMATTAAPATTAATTAAPTATTATTTAAPMTTTQTTAMSTTTAIPTTTTQTTTASTTTAAPRTTTRTTKAATTTTTTTTAAPTTTATTTTTTTTTAAPTTTTIKTAAPTSAAPSTTAAPTTSSANTTATAITKATSTTSTTTTTAAPTTTTGTTTATTAAAPTVSITTRSAGPSTPTATTTAAPTVSITTSSAEPSTPTITTTVPPSTNEPTTVAASTTTKVTTTSFSTSSTVTTTAAPKLSTATTTPAMSTTAAATAASPINLAAMNTIEPPKTTTSEAPRSSTGSATAMPSTMMSTITSSIATSTEPIVTKGTSSHVPPENGDSATKTTSSPTTTVMATNVASTTATISSSSLTATTAPPTETDATAPATVSATLASMESSAAKGTSAQRADKDSPQTLTTVATPADTAESSSMSNTVETSLSAPATPLSASTAPSDISLLGKPGDKPSGTGNPVSTTPSSPGTTGTEEVPAASGSSAVIGNTVSGTAQVSSPASDVENASMETAKPHSLETLSSSPEPDLNAVQASETTEESIDIGSEANSSGSPILGSSVEDPAPTPLFDGEDTESSPMDAHETNTFSSVIPGTVPPMSVPASTSKKPITMSATGSSMPGAALGGNSSAVVSDTVNNDRSEELDTVTLLMTPDPRPSEEGKEEDDLMGKEQASPSPESDKESEEFDFLIPKSPGRPPLTPSPPETNEDVFDLFPGDSSGPKSTSFDGPQTLMENMPADISPSEEPEDPLLPEASAEEPTPIGSVLGSMLDSLAVEKSPTPTSSVGVADNTYISFPELVDSLSSFRDPGIIGPVPLPTMEDGNIGMEASEVLDSLEPTSDAFDVKGFLNSMGEDLMASIEPESSGEPELSGEPEASMEILPSSEIELEDVDLIVKYPDSLDPDVIAEEIRFSSNELTQSIQWDEAGFYLVSNLSKFGSAISVVRQADQVSTFELNFQTICLDPSSCDSELKTYQGFVRDGKMDETLSAHDLAGVNVYIKGDIVDRSTPPGLDMSSAGGLNAGVIAGIAIGAVASISLLAFGVLFVTKRGHKREGRRDPELGGIESYHGSGDGRHQSQHEGEEEGSFMISNFGGSPRNTEALIPWMSNSSEGTGKNGHGSATSFTSVDTAGSAELVTNYLTNYRFEETTSSGSGSDFGDIDVEEVDTR